MKTIQIPLFPLHTVLFPDGPLPLRVFEARYLDMISTCLKSDCPFGVALIQEGKEVGEVASTHPVGTLAKIIDWHTGHDGLLGITAQGQQRFRIASVQVQPNKLAMAKVEILASEPVVEMSDRFIELADLLRRIIDQAGHHYATLPRNYTDSTWVGFRLAELLPISLSKKQYLLQFEDATGRLEMLYEMLEGLEIV